jgi:hypothetical protein
MARDDGVVGRMRRGRRGCHRFTEEAKEEATRWRGAERLQTFARHGQMEVGGKGGGGEGVLHGMDRAKGLGQASSLLLPIP